MLVAHDDDTYIMDLGSNNLQWLICYKTKVTFIFQVDRITVDLDKT